MASLSIAKVERVHPRAAFRVFLIIALLGLCLPLHGLWRLVGARSPWAIIFLKWAGKAAGAKVKIVGQPVKHNILYIANHVSWLDILVLAGETGSAFVAKADMIDWPVLGWLASLNNSVYVQRDNRLDVGTQRDAIQAALLTGQPITLFPEGTTANGKELLPFRSSLLATVAPPPQGITVQPVAIDYGPAAPEIAWVEDTSVGQNALMVMARPGRLDVTLHFLEPLDHSEFENRKAMAAHSRAEIAAALFPTYSAQP
jgi:lyso-ornithine lipid O-acyltransferase